jgi:2-keto-3-deoxy-L-rhamnonate aldolase RhmA
MTGKNFKEALVSGKSVYGTLITSVSPRMFELVKNLELDFVFFCNEHIFYNPDMLGWMCRAYNTAGINPVVRILEPSASLATQALDAGARTILVPYAEKIEDIYNIVGAVKYRPLKGEKLNRILYGKEKPSEELAAYLKSRNGNNTLLLNIESPAGMKNMEQFFSVRSPDGPGVDGIIIGPHDLSVSYDMPEQYNNEVFLNLTCEIIKKARSHGIAAGGHTGFRGSLALQTAWAKAGANIILHSSDLFLFADKLRDEMNLIREVKGEKTIKRETGDYV